MSFIRTLERIVEARASESNAESSYTQRLLDAGVSKIAQKVGEEGVEVALAAVIEDDAALIGECADLIYHMTVLLNARELNWSDVEAELERRHKR